MNNNCLTDDDFTSIVKVVLFKTILLSKAIVIPPYSNPAFFTYCAILELLLTEVSVLSTIVPTPPPKLVKIEASEVSKSFTNSPPSHASIEPLSGACPKVKSSKKNISSTPSTLGAASISKNSTILFLSVTVVVEKSNVNVSQSPLPE